MSIVRGRGREDTFRSLTDPSPALLASDTLLEAAAIVGGGVALSRASEGGSGNNNEEDFAIGVRDKTSTETQVHSSSAPNADQAIAHGWFFQSLKVSADVRGRGQPRRETRPGIRPSDLSSLLYFHTPTRLTSLVEIGLPSGVWRAAVGVSHGDDLDSLIDRPPCSPLFVPVGRIERPIFQTSKITKGTTLCSPHRLPPHTGARF